MAARGRKVLDAAVPVSSVEVASPGILNSHIRNVLVEGFKVVRIAKEVQTVSCLHQRHVRNKHLKAIVRVIGTRTREVRVWRAQSNATALMIKTLHRGQKWLIPHVRANRKRITASDPFNADAIRTRFREVGEVEECNIS